jgi:hypothetical protein
LEKLISTERYSKRYQSWLISCIFIGECFIYRSNEMSVSFHLPWIVNN